MSLFSPSSAPKLFLGRRSSPPNTTGGFNPSVGILGGQTPLDAVGRRLPVVVSIPQSGFLVVKPAQKIESELPEIPDEGSVAVMILSRRRKDGEES